MEKIVMDMEKVNSLTKTNFLLHDGNLWEIIGMELPGKYILKKVTHVVNIKKDFSKSKSMI